MATAEGVRKLARMILSFYPETKLDLTDDRDAALWAAVLREASDRDVLRALAEHVRSGNRFAPNAGEIAARCLSKAKALPASGPVRELELLHTRLCARYRTLGVPTASEAKDSGMSWDEWERAADAAEANAEDGRE